MFQLMWAGRLSPFYRLDFQSSTDGMKFVLEVKADAAEIVLASLSNLRRAATTAPGMPTFIPPDQSFIGWGYDPVVVETTNSKNDDWRIFEIDIPRGIRVPLDYIAEDCNITEMERTTVSGETLMAAKCISGTLALLFNALYFDCEDVTGESKEPPSQGFLIEGLGHAGMTDGEQGRCGVSVMLDPSVTQWLQSLSQAGDKPREMLEREARQAITSLYSWLAGYKATTDRTHWSCAVVITDNGHLQMRTEGDATTLDSNGKQVQRLTPHNVDGAIQQLSLLAGIAAIWRAFTRRLQIK
jgi:hypothetical protein